MIRILPIIGLLLLIPLIAMQLTNEVNWSFFDFIIMGGMLTIAGLLIGTTLKKVNSYNNRLVIVSIPPIIIKSKKDQFTSLVNCIAINGIKSNSPTIYKILIIILKSKYNTYILIPSFLLISFTFVGFFVCERMGRFG